MSVTLAAPAFVVAAVVSLATSWVLVSRLERVGERLGFSEALLGLVAALAADAPEVTAAVTALSHHQQQVGAGVVIGSNVFNLAALLGLGAVVAGRIGLHRKVVVLGGAVAVWMAAVCLAVVLGWIPALAGVVLVGLAMAAYVLVLGGGGRGLRLPPRWTGWLAAAVSEEEQELEGAIRPRRATTGDVVVASVSLMVVVVASVVMERAASTLGRRYGVAEIVVGGLVLAAVTSLPNAVAAVYLAARGRGAATFSTALNSNTINVAVGLLIPATLIALGKPSGQTVLIAAWYVGLTVVVLGFAYVDRGITRTVGILIIGAYAVFVASVLTTAISPNLPVVITLAVLVAVASGAALVLKGRHGLVNAEPRPRSAEAGPDGPNLPPPLSANGSGTASRRQPIQPIGRWDFAPARPSVVPGWSVSRVWTLALILPTLVAGADAALGHRVVLIGLLIVGPCCSLLSGRWGPTALAGVWATGLAVLLGLPDGIWASRTHLTFIAAVALVAVVTTVAAAILQTSDR